MPRENLSLVKYAHLAQRLGLQQEKIRQCAGIQNEESPQVVEGVYRKNRQLAGSYDKCLDLLNNSARIVRTLWRWSLNIQARQCSCFWPWAVVRTICGTIAPRKPLVCELVLEKVAEQTAAAVELITGYGVFLTATAPRRRHHLLSKTAPQMPQTAPQVVLPRGSPRARAHGPGVTGSMYSF
jgi:hypothetical protein